MAVVSQQQIRTGPTLSGSLSAETEAQVRAEVAGAVIQTSADAGMAVRAGQTLARIDDAAVRDQHLSARSGVTTAQNNVTVAQREVERAEALAKAGAIAERQLEQARNGLLGTQAQLADARARLTMAEKQLEKTVIRAPFSGVVSAKTVSAGDVIAPGAPLFTIINPATMRLEASVPAEQLNQVRVGLPVEFTVTGYPTRRFTGRVSRINPVADPSTRQVRVLVSIPNPGPLVSGLFAEGRIASETRNAPVVPASAIDEQGVRPIVMRVKNGKVEKVEVVLGIRDAATEMMEVQSGLAVGDTILLGAARGISVGTMVKVSVPADVKR
jgi:RND family efflux transporter MFP subunit